MKSLNFCRELVDPRVGSSIGFLRNSSPKMLTSDSPTCHFQFRQAAVSEVHFSAKKIDAAASHECSQRLLDGSWGRDFQQATVPDSM